jgi:hypothetical protein
MWEIGPIFRALLYVCCTKREILQAAKTEIMRHRWDTIVEDQPAKQSTATCTPLYSRGSRPYLRSSAHFHKWALTTPVHGFST